jgi:hypothetical protein
MRFNNILLAISLIAFNKVLMLPRLIKGSQLLLLSVQGEDGGFAGEIDTEST